MSFWIPLLLAGCATVDDGPRDTESPTAVGAVVARCTYVNAFSQGTECKEYIGAGWTEESAATDCAAPLASTGPGDLELGLACDRSSFLGECLIDEGTDEASTLVFPGQAGDSCDGLGLGCGFAGGDFVPSDLCEGATGGTVPSGGVFQPFQQVCVDPLPGEPVGASDNGQVCTWEAISASTEAGRYYADYADCDTVLTQRPYYPASAEPEASEDDPRLDDPAWVAEYDWVTSQVEATACVCCHTEAEAPQGPSGWYLEAGPIWTDTLDDDGMAMMAGWVDSTAFGAFDPAENNGFAREITGMPSTDPARMLAFFEGELLARGLGPSDFVETPPFGGPLYDQLVFEPSDCAAGEGISADGTITWTGGNARYVYLLQPEANPPGVPPNLDLPQGTVWRLDVDWQAEPLATGITYGSEPMGSFQQWPEVGQAPELQSGQSYFLYVLADIYVPLTRCLFTAP